MLKQFGGLFLTLTKNFHLFYPMLTEWSIWWLNRYGNQLPSSQWSLPDIQRKKGHRKLWNSCSNGWNIQWASSRPSCRRFSNHCTIFMLVRRHFTWPFVWISLWKYLSLTEHKLEIRSCPSDNGLTLPDATMHTVKFTADVLNFIRLGEMNRFMSSTAMNNRSSRSHRSVFKIELSIM